MSVSHIYCMVCFLDDLCFKSLGALFICTFNWSQNLSVYTRCVFLLGEVSACFRIRYVRALQYEDSVEFLWAPWESKHSQLWVGSRLPANQNSAHYVLLPGETCLPKFLASKHRHVEFVRVAIYSSTANSATVGLIPPTASTSHQPAAWSQLQSTNEDAQTLLLQ